MLKKKVDEKMKIDIKDEIIERIKKLNIEESEIKSFIENWLESILNDEEKFREEYKEE